MTKTSITRLRHLDMLKTAFGAVIEDALHDRNVIEVMVNPDGRVWLDVLGEGRRDTGQRLAAPDAERIIRLVANTQGTVTTKGHPIVSGELPESGERFEGLLPPIVTAPSFAIRKQASKIFTLKDYVTSGNLSAAQADFLQEAIASRKNLLVAGGTSSGKTTLINALLAEVERTQDRVLILEDTRELQCAARDCVTLRTTDSVNLCDLVRSTLRLRPDRIIVGEVRGGEALDLLKAWNTGHPGGLTTLHANSAKGALLRLEQLIQEAVTTVPRAVIADAVDVIVFIAKRDDTRAVENIVTVDGLDHHGDYILTPIPSQPILLIQSNSSEVSYETQ